LNNNGIISVDLAGNKLLSGYTSQFFTIDNAIYVSTTGDNTNPGYHRELPVKTINSGSGSGVEKAILNGYTRLKISTGTYNEDLVLDSSYNNFIFEGGWDDNFLDTGPDPDTNITEINPLSSAYTIQITGNAKNITLSGLHINGGTTGNNGSILINGNSSNITVEECWVFGATSGLSGTGISVDTPGTVTIRKNEEISGGAASQNTAINIGSSAKDVRIADNDKIYGGTVGKVHGILIGPGAGPVVIEENDEIIAGDTSLSSTFGIYIGNNAQVLIQDNALISGGTTTSSDTVGIQVESGALSTIYRNTIFGGEEYTSNNNNNYGIFLSSSAESNIFNNFITGGGYGTDMNNECYGIFASDSNVNIINNTINGGGNNGIFISNAIWISDSPWNIDPRVINNIILPGTNLNKYGIWLVSTSSIPYQSSIFNNTFNDLLDVYLLINSTPYATVNALNSTNDVSPQPGGNEDYRNGNIDFNGNKDFQAPVGYDYHVNETGSTPGDIIKIKNNGYDLSTISGLSGDYIHDIDELNRNIQTTDRGAHEFSP
jgi:hypothetical protein